MAALPIPLAVRWSLPALRLQALAQRWRRTLGTRRRPSLPGRCLVCGKATRFVHTVDNAREDPVCRCCGSVPRQRAVAATLSALGVLGPDAAVHESSPSLCSFLDLRRRSRGYVATYFRPGVPAGARLGAFRCVDLGRQPFADASFDVVVTQDVLEHLPAPAPALQEIRRTLRPGGVHVFTVPRAPDRATTARAVLEHGVLRQLQPAVHHRDPADPQGALVVTDWGMDLEALVADLGGTPCTTRTVVAPDLGIPAPVEVFVARRPS